MSSYKARMEIPEIWAEKGHCPICNKTALRVVHHAGEPDQLACVSCGCSFEIEADGPNIRMVRIGPDYKVKLQAADGIWMPVVDIHQQLVQSVRQENPGKEPNPNHKPLENKPQTSNPPGSDMVEATVRAGLLNQEEVTRRAIALAELGNKSSNIRTTLTHVGVSEEMVAIALEEIKSRKVKRKSPLPLALAVTIIVVVGCLGGAALYLPKINPWALIGPLVTPLNALNSSENKVTPTPVSAGIGLPADGSQYFSVIWNLTGDYSEKASQIDSVIPPADLEAVNAQIVESLHQTGSLETAYKKCQTVYDQQKCYEAQAEGDPFCVTKAAECSGANLSFLQEQTKLYSLWLGTACKAFEDYYSKNAVEFPFPQGNCNYP